MSRFRRIDYENWDRRELYEFFGRTTIYMTVQLDIRPLWDRVKAAGQRLYPALLYCAAKVVNGDPAFRYDLDGERRVGRWDRLDPYYTVPRRGAGDLFSMVCTPYTESYADFYRAYLRDAEAAAACGRLICGELPPNGFGVTAVPGTHYASFCFTGDPKTDLKPFVAYGGVQQEGEKRLLPVTVEFAHGVNDGAHVSRFFARLESELRGLEL